MVSYLKKNQNAKDKKKYHGPALGFAYLNGTANFHQNWPGLAVHHAVKFLVLLYESLNS